MALIVAVFVATQAGIVVAPAWPRPARSWPIGASPKCCQAGAWGALVSTQGIALVWMMVPVSRRAPAPALESS